MTTWLPAALGAGLLVLSFLWGPSFYPPGEGYAEEKRNMRISLALMLAGLAMIAAPLVMAAAGRG